MTYVFDLDNTICITDGSKYEQSKPIKDRIELINNLYDNQNSIIIFTARGMGSTGNNQVEAINRYFALTKNQLDTWGVKYHSLVLGKPAGDFYIDDKGINDNEFFKRNP